MFAGLGNQISGFVSQKMGKAEAADGEVVEGQQVVEGQENGEGGEVPQEGGGGAMGSAMGFAQGLMMKANAVKEGVAAKASTLGAGNLQAPFGGGGDPAEGGEQPLVEGQEGGEVPQEGMEGEQPTGAMGFAAGLMMKAHTLKEGVKEKSSGINLGNVQSMAGGVMGQVQGLIPGMRKEEEVPEPAPQEEYQEYAEDGQQYQEEQYTE